MASIFDDLEVLSLNAGYMPLLCLLVYITKLDSGCLCMDYVD